MHFKARNKKAVLKAIMRVKLLIIRDLLRRGWDLKNLISLILLELQWVKTPNCLYLNHNVPFQYLSV